MEIFQVVIIGIIATLLSIILKSQRPEMSLKLSLATGIMIFLLIAGKLYSIVGLISGYAQKVQIDTAYVGTLLKIIGIAYITEFGAEVCKDAGEGAIASKIELTGKVIIVVLAVPIITSVLDLVINIMP